MPPLFTGPRSFLRFHIVVLAVLAAAVITGFFFSLDDEHLVGTIGLFATFAAAAFLALFVQARLSGDAALTIERMQNEATEKTRKHHNEVEALIASNKALHATEREGWMREAGYRSLNVETMDKMLDLARQLSTSHDSVDARDGILLCCLAVLDRQIALRRKDHSDLHALIHCFEKGDKDQLRVMFMDLRDCQSEKFEGFVGQFPSRIEKFFRDLVAPALIEG